MDDATLRTIWQQKQPRYFARGINDTLSQLMNKKIAKIAKQIGELAEIWDELIPESIKEHTALESFQRGILTVMVDSAAHRFQLQTLLSSGLMKEIQNRYSNAINKIRLVPGQFCSIDIETGNKKYEF